MDKLGDIFLGLAAVATIAIGVWLLVDASSKVGPNCPGMDPEWLGWCVESEEAKNG